MSMTTLEGLDVRGIAQSMGTRIAYRAGDPVFRRGDAARHMYVVLSGRVSVSAGGKVIDVIDPGMGLGTLSLIDGQARSADAVAELDSELALIDARQFRYMVEEVPGFCWFVMAEMAHRLRATNAAL